MVVCSQILCDDKINFKIQDLMLKTICSNLLSLLISLELAGNFCQAEVKSIIQPIIDQHPNQTGTYLLEKGQDALVARAWLAANARESINVQYFIWSVDPVGILAIEALLSAAERGVKVKVIVDDFLLQADSKSLSALDAHENIEIKVYNPVVRTGVTTIKKYYNLINNFKKFNQRMHDKTFTVDRVAGITGGRNMADEYFDYDNQYTFRDRDVLVIGDVVNKMEQSFELYWNSELAVALKLLYPIEPTKKESLKIQKDLHDFASNPENYPSNIKESINNLQQHFEKIIDDFDFAKVEWLFDLPGKNLNTDLSGLGHSTKKIMEVLESAKQTILIQSPYLVLDQAALTFFHKLAKRGIKIRIITNSLESTDNLAAFSGYHKIRKQLLAWGIQLYEFKAYPQIEETLMQRYKDLAKKPIFAIHAKSFVVDQQIAYIGTFNLDPRSINLNTEVGVLIKNQLIADKLKSAIEEDLKPENSYNLSFENPEKDVSFAKRLKLWFYKLLPIQKLL